MGGEGREHIVSPSSEVRERPWGGGLAPMGGVTVLPRGRADKVVALVGLGWSALVGPK